MAATVVSEYPISSVTSPSSRAPVASLHAVSKKYGSHVALDRFSIELHAGEVVALLGPNGAGKTTAVRLLLGLSEANSGEVSIFGGNPRERANRERLGAMLQVGRMPETLRVREHLELFCSYYPHPRPLDELLAIAGLEGAANQFFGKLSGGQKQRMLFALALCGNPDLIFLDEPTLGMDVEARRSLWRQVRRLSAEKKTILLTTHYLEEADYLASRIVVMQKGSIVAEGTPQQLKSSQGSRSIRCTTVLPISFLMNLPDVISAELDGVTTLVRTHSPETVLRRMLEADATLTGLEVRSAGLEETFLALTQNQQ